MWDVVWGKMRKEDEASEQNSKKGTEEKLAVCEYLLFLILTVIQNIQMQ